MMLLRSATQDDLGAIYQLAIRGGFGLTTLPADENLLHKRLNWSLESFEKQITHPNGEYYLFVLEDTTTGHVVGTSAIEASTGYDTPFYSYKLTRRTRVSHELNIRTDYDVLNLVNDMQGTSEICTLFLDPEYRVNANGTLLSRSRFLFIADHRHRFSPTIIAEMRGIIDEQGNSPFWDAIASHFFNLPFVKADRLTTSTNKQYIADLMPRNPIYVKLIDPKAQAVIGQPHESTRPAMNILLKEGFRYNNYIDIFDGGPTIEAPREEIRTITASQVLEVKRLSDNVSSKRYLVSNGKLDYRAIICEAVFNSDEKTCILSKKDAEILNIQLGDSVRIAPLKLIDQTIYTREEHDTN